MRKRKVQRATRERAPALEVTKAISHEELLEIRKAEQRVAFAATELDAARMALRLLVAKKLKELEMPIQTSALCLTCGTIRPQANMPCPVCPQPHRRPSAMTQKG